MTVYGEMVDMTDEENRSHPHEFLDYIEFEGKEYLILLSPWGDELFLLEFEGINDSGLESYVGVEDEAVLNAVFGIFHEETKNYLKTECLVDSFSPYKRRLFCEQ